MADDRAGRFDRADFEARPRELAGPMTAERELPAAQALPTSEKATPAKPPALPPPPPAPVAVPATPPIAAASSAAPAWRRSDLRPDDQIVNIVETGPAPVAPLVDDARSGFVLRDGDSNRVILVDTGPAPTQRVTQGTAVPLVQGSPVALAQGAAVPMTAGQAVPLSQGTATPTARDTSPLSIIKEVLGNPALRKAATNALSSERSGDVAQQEQGESNLLSTALGSVLSNFNSS